MIKLYMFLCGQLMECTDDLFVVTLKQHVTISLIDCRRSSDQVDGVRSHSKIQVHNDL